jgi:23S rRNA (cytosine1962-C5)-methyltransferase
LYPSAVHVFPHPEFANYELLDSGRGEKLERFGDYVLRRPDPQALWKPKLSSEAWSDADLRFVRESDRGGRWDGSAPKSWNVDLGKGACVRIQPTPFKHVGLFPEQASNWDYAEKQRVVLAKQGIEQPRLLNLFGYTGAATILAARAGWAVTHCDASRASMDWAAENAQRSGLDEKAVRWMLEDAAKFAAREQRRGKTYHGILLDPPHYGRGPKGEKWQFETDIAPLLTSCQGLLDEMAGSFLVLSTYAIGYSPLAFSNMLQEFPSVTVETGELALPEKGNERFLPCGFCARAVRV